MSRKKSESKTHENHISPHPSALTSRDMCEYVCTFGDAGVKFFSFKMCRVICVMTCDFPLILNVCL